MTHPAFMGLTRGMYRSLLNCIEGLHRQGATVIEVIQSIQYVSNYCVFKVSLNPAIEAQKPPWMSPPFKRN